MQMQSASQGKSSTDGSVQVGINLEKMLEGQKATAIENKEIFGVEKVENFTSMRTPNGDLLIMKAHELAKKEIKALYPDIKSDLL
jgi:beta-glucosidase